MYNGEKRYVGQQERAGKVLVLRPKAPLCINPIEKDPNELQRVYDHGRDVALENLQKIKDYLQE